jgi:predicted nucleic acid-binding protein
MMVVVDASVAVKWFVEEPGREQAISVLGAAERQAPDLIVVEVGNVAWKKASRGEITAAQARFICASLRRYFTVLHRSEALIDRAIDLALRLRHPIYDCLYLACAERAGVRLVTADQKLLAMLAGTSLAPLAVRVDAFTGT